MKDIFISNDIIYIGADDKEIDLFENQYNVPNGISYNSYLIKDEKIAVMDTIDKRKTKEWIDNLENALNGKNPDYLVISHLEPDHAYNIEYLSKKYPEMKLVGNDKTFAFIPQFFNIPNLEERKVLVKEGDTLSLGKHTLKFFMAPMVHWPEVMVEYEEYEKILFTADAFGKFGSLDTDEPWDDEGRRYYINIVGKYGLQVQNLLKKASTLDIKMICPLHGPILKDNLEHYINKYNIWSSYTPEEDGIFIACSSIHGNTFEACKVLKEILEKNGAKKVILSDLSRADMAESVANAFRYSKIIFAASSYNFGVFTPMKQLLMHLQERNFQNRTVGIIENGTWAPTAGKCMQDILVAMKNINIIDPLVTIRSRLNEESKLKLEELSKNILKIS